MNRHGTNKVKRKLITTFMLIGLAILGQTARAGSVGDFFKALGNSIAHPGQHPKPKPRDSQNSSKRPAKDAAVSADLPPTPNAPAAPTPTPTPTVPQPVVRPASVPSDTKNKKRDIPYGIPVPGKPGFVTSPYAPKQGLVDVRSFPSGTEVKDPYTGKIFLTP
ncbi:MAG: hypothetical protein QOF24_1974 [Verrucomicrobiota bacterium]|jgi:hypothetical protein